MAGSKMNSESARLDTKGNEDNMEELRCNSSDDEDHFTSPFKDEQANIYDSV